MFCCQHCGNTLDSRKRDCNYCFESNDAPNVRLARAPDEVTCLDAKYQEAIVRMPKGHNKVRLRFEQVVKNDGRVAIARSAIEVSGFINNRDSLYQNYHMQVLSGQRVAGSGQIDTVRTQFENTALPNLSDKIRFGALSINGSGVPYFGSATMILKPDTCINRTTFFYGNPLTLVKQLGIGAEETIPYGYRSDWDNCYKLAVAKHGKQLKQHMKTTDEFQSLIVSQTTDGPDYIEAHIFEGFPPTTIEKIVYNGPVVDGDLEYIAWEMIRAISAANYPEMECVIL